MNIKIDKYKLSTTELRKLKLATIQNETCVRKEGYNWKLDYESADESLEDLHLFCISIVKDLLYKRFITNEKGSHTYEGMKEEYDETIADLEHLFWLIEKTKRNENRH